MSRTKSGFEEGEFPKYDQFLLECKDFWRHLELSRALEDIYVQHVCRHHDLKDTGETLRTVFEREHGVASDIVLSLAGKRSGSLAQMREKAKIVRAFISGEEEDDPGIRLVNSLLDELVGLPLCDDVHPKVRTKPIGVNSLSIVDKLTGKDQDQAH